ncbi:MAG: hypothetical protein JO263_11005 [Candidatus Eremiobacteraeota bacterium]|nr:hypothetical protein [Candidatus Eremiobacteraeota bacterium]
MVLAAGCSANAGLGTYPGLPASGTRVERPATQGKIQHVVIVVQENRSFNNLFYKFPGAKTAKFGYDSRNRKITLQPVPLETVWDIDHNAASFFAACNGTGSIPGTNCRMNGFDKEIAGCGHPGQPKCPSAHPEYSYVPHSETKPYFDMGKQYVVADQMYSSNFDGSSFVSHQYIIAGQAESSVDYPLSGLWGCPGGPSDTISIVGPLRQIPYGSEVVCWDPNTLGDELDRAHVPWAYYTSSIYGDGDLWSAYQAISHIYYGSDWKKDVISPQTKFFDAVADGKLPAVSWITPTWKNSDHAGSASNAGPSWVASLVNAIGESKYWNTTAIFILWDDFGGWYDPEPPAYADYDGLGFRLPLLVVSPYAKAGYVSHVHYEHGSVLKFVEDLFGLKRLAASDSRANSPAQDCFDFSQSPRKFVPIASLYSRAYFRREPIDTHAPDTY